MRLIIWENSRRLDDSLSATKFHYHIDIEVVFIEILPTVPRLVPNAVGLVSRRFLNQIL